MRYRLAWTVLNLSEPRVKDIVAENISEAENYAWNIISQGDLDGNIIEEVSIYDEKDNWIKNVGI